MKKILKKIMPKRVFLIYRGLVNKFELNKINRDDKNRFFNSASLVVEDYDLDQVRFRLIYATHGIEKGLSHENLRLGFGKDQLVYIKSILDDFMSLGGKNNEKEFLDTISVLKEYREVHQKKDFNLQYFDEIFFDYLDIIKEMNMRTAGIIKKKKLGKAKSDFSFKELSQSRYSVRDFSNEEVETKTLIEAVEMSMKTPSACNRQMWRTKIIKDKKLIQEVLEYQGGFRGYETPPALFLTTVSLKSFQFPRERNQAFVDGGMFSMSLIYSLESLGLVSCALNSELTIDIEKKMRKLLKLEENEVTIMFIAAGYEKDIYKVCKSPRVETKKIYEIIG